MGPRRTMLRKAVAAGVVLAVTVGLAASGAVAAEVTVRPGDTLSGIAARHGVTVTALASANGIADADRILAGDRLTVPGGAPVGGTGAAPAGSEVTAGRSHTVLAGETLSHLAKRYGVSVSSIASANAIANPDVIVAGRTLQIGTSTGSAPAGGGSSTAIRSGGSLPAKLVADPARMALRPTFARWANEYGVPVDLLEGLAWVESGWQRTVISHAGAVGIGQLMPATVEHVRLLLRAPDLDPFNAEDNIRMSARFLRFLLDQTGGDVRAALGAYYQGLRSVRTLGQFPETVQYIDTVLGARSRF